MSQVLIVDDDPVPLRLLVRALTARNHELQVQSASNGLEAIERLAEASFDVVLTDLQMPEMNGFELVAWVLHHQPQLTVFTMTAYHDEAAMARLHELGEIECFVKPLDVSDVYERLMSALADGMQGRVRNVSLASMLQLIQMERKTCTLSVVSEERRGLIFIREGAIVHAQHADGEGEAAAIEIASWTTPEISIGAVCRTSQRTVHRPTGFIVMEAMRLLDEQSRGPEEEPVRAEDDEISFAGLTFSSVPPPPKSQAPASPSVSAPSALPAEAACDADAIVIVDLAGNIESQSGDHPSLGSMAVLVAEVYRLERDTVAKLALGDAIEELVVTCSRAAALAIPLSGPGLLVMGLFDPDRVNLAMCRLEVRRHALELGSRLDLPAP